MWINYAEQNWAIALMAEGRAEEALPVFTSREDVDANRDLNHANIAICYYLLKRYQEALSYCDKAIELSRERRGDNNASMAM